MKKVMAFETIHEHAAGIDVGAEWRWPALVRSHPTIIYAW